MNLLQAYSSSLRSTVRTRRPGVKIRHAKTKRTASPPAASPSSDRVAVSSTAHDHPTLVQQALEGNSNAHEPILATHANKRRGMAFAILRSREAAQAAAQDGLCRAFANFQSFQGRSSF